MGELFVFWVVGDIYSHRIESCRHIIQGQGNGIVDWDVQVHKIGDGLRSSKQAFCGGVGLSG
jgi:hypothetical protein